MDTGVIIAIAVVALVVIIALVLMRKAGEGRRRERELTSRRDEVVTEHKSAAHERLQAAEAAEQQVRIERAAAEQEIAKAELTAQGHRDHEIAPDLTGDRDRAVTTDDADASPDGSRLTRDTRDETVAEDTPPADTRRP